MSDENNQVSSGDQLAGYAKKWLEALLSLEPNISQEQIAERRGVVKQLLTLYSASGAEFAEKKFKEHYEAFETIAKVNQALNEAEQGSRGDSKGLKRVSKDIAGLNVVQATLLGNLLSKLPAVGMIGSALTSLASLEQTMIGISGKPQVFATLGSLLESTDQRLKEFGIELSLDGLKDHAQQIKDSKVGQNAIASIAKIEEAIANSDITATLQNAVGNSPIGEKLLQPIAKFAAGFGSNSVTKQIQH